MASFQYLVEAIAAKNSLKPDDDSNKKIAAIKVGLNTRFNNKPGSTFWDDFIRVCGDSESLSHLLGVNKFVIANWPSEIKKYLTIVQEQMANNVKRNNMINTGDGQNHEKVQ